MLGSEMNALVINADNLQQIHVPCISCNDKTYTLSLLLWTTEQYLQLAIAVKPLFSAE